MAEVDLQAVMRSLRASLRQIKSLMAWEQLKQSEARPDQPPAYQISDPTETDLRNEYSFFLSASTQMHNMLNDSAGVVSKAKLQHLEIQLAKVEQQLHNLNLHRRFYKC
jgi:hypothetical protein